MKNCSQFVYHLEQRGIVAYKKPTNLVKSTKKIKYKTKKRKRKRKVKKKKKKKITSED